MRTTHVKLINTPGTRVGSGYHDKMLAIDVVKKASRLDQKIQVVKVRTNIILKYIL